MIDSSGPASAGRPGHFLDELRATFAARAGRAAISYQDRIITYGELEARAQRCAARMRKLGLEPGDRVAIVTSEKLPFLAAHLGTLYASAVSLPLNPRLTADELRYFLQDSGARVVVAGQDEWPVIESLQARAAGAARPAARPRGLGCPGGSSAGARGRPRRSLPDALQLGHDRPAQGRRAHARQPRLQPAGAAATAGGSRPTTCWSTSCRCSTSTGSRSRRT